MNNENELGTNKWPKALENKLTVRVNGIESFDFYKALAEPKRLRAKKQDFRRID